MNSQLTGCYRYSPLSKAQAVMLLINHLSGDESVTKSDAESIIERCTKTRPKGCQGLPEEITVLQGVKGLKGSCLIDPENIDLSIFPGQEQNDIIAVLEEGKRKFCKGYMFIRQEYEKKGLISKMTQVLCIVMSFLSLTSFALTEIVNGIEWSYTIEADGAMLGTSDIHSLNAYSPCVDPNLEGVVRVPESLGGIPVVAIGVLAFRFTGKVTELWLPKTIARISRVSFAGQVSKSSSYGGSYTEYLPATYPQNVIFLGDKPECSIPNSTYNGDWPISHSIASSSYYVRGQFAAITCYHVKGNSSWNGTTYFESSRDSLDYNPQWKKNVYPGLAMVSVAPRESIIKSDLLQVSLEASASGCNILYTTDGSDPNVSGAAYDGPFTVAVPSEVKAIATFDGSKYTYVSSTTLERQANSPVINSTQGAEFPYSTDVSIECIDDVDIRYTTDNTPVTEDSTIFVSPFSTSETITVRAKAFKEGWLPSEEVMQTFTRVWYTNETPVISAASVAFDAASQEVAISCATEGATVYYTIDESEPSAANGRVYKGPFNIYDSVTVKAIAVKDDWKDSAVASAAFTKNNGLSAAINMYDYLPDNDANCPWTVDAAVSHDGVSSVRSGMLSADGGTTTMKVTVKGAGKLSFWWKSECEEGCDGEYYDYGAFRIGTADPLAYIAGDSGWQRFETEIASTGKHILKWEYHKDDAESIPRDCIWVDQVQWVPADDSGHTLTTGVPVPYSWLESYGFGAETDFESAAKMKLGKVDGAGRAVSVEDDYVAGTDPTNLESKLTATIKMGADGKPILSWKPPLNGEAEEGAGIREGVRRYSVLGKRDLGDVEEKWTPVTEGDESGYRFFKVKVNMP